jgi:hypothetical protein
MGFLAKESPMALKPGGEICQIREQIIEDRASGLTFQFIHAPGTDAPFRLVIGGDLPFGNREILFNADGEMAGAGTALSGSCRPSWIREIKN